MSKALTLISRWHRLPADFREWLADAGIGPVDLERIEQEKLCNHYRPRQTIVYQANPCTGLHIVARGTVAMVWLDHQGNDHIARLEVEGGLIGYDAYFSGQNHATSALALTECQVSVLTRETLQRLLEQYPRLKSKFLSRMAQDIVVAYDRTQDASLPAIVRVADLLLRMRTRFGEVLDDGTLRLTLPLTRREMASMIGIRPETMSRTIRRLGHLGAASFGKCTIDIIDLDELLDIHEWRRDSPTERLGPLPGQRAVLSAVPPSPAP